MFRNADLSGAMMTYMNIIYRLVSSFLKLLKRRIQNATDNTMISYNVPSNDAITINISIPKCLFRINHVNVSYYMSTVLL